MTSLKSRVRSHVPQATITFVNASAKAESAASPLVLNAPSTPTSGDLWIAVVGSAGAYPLSLSGWNTIVVTAHPNIRVATWSYQYEGATPNLSVEQYSGGDSLVGGIVVFRNCKRVYSPVNIYGVGNTSLSGTAITIGGLTPSASNCMLLAVDATRDDNYRTVIPTGFTAAFEDTAGGTQNCYLNTVGVNQSSVAAHYKLHTTGATGDFTDTQSASNSWASRLIAIEPR